MADLSSLSKIIVDAARASNVGVSGLNTAQVGDVLTIADFKTETNRNDISATNPLIVMKNAQNKQLSISANAIPSLRVQSLSVPAGFSAATVLAGVQFATGLTQRPEFMFMKEFIDSLDGQFDASKLKLTCVARLNVPSTNDQSKPAMVPSAYNGMTEYFAALADAGNDPNAIARAREDLHNSGIRAGMESYTPQTHPEFFVWVPVFTASVA